MDELHVSSLHHIPAVGEESIDPKLEAIRQYWDEHIPDLEIATQPLGTHEFFEELAEYRFDKLRYLPKLVDFLLSPISYSWK